LHTHRIAIDWDWIRLGFGFRIWFGLRLRLGFGFGIWFGLWLGFWLRRRCWRRTR
jgi:hypothetical protein